jgi:hypothetical protein
MDHGMSTAVECTMCDGELGWWVTATPQRAGAWIRCTRCEGTGVEPFDVAALTDAELVAYVEAADIEGHIETDCHASYGSSQPGTVYVMEDGTVSGDWGDDVAASLLVWVHAVDVDTTTVEITDSIERFT